MISVTNCQQLTNYGFKVIDNDQNLRNLIHIIDPTCII